MRPINLIPADQRRNSRSPARTGPIAYLIVGALALGLGAVTLLVLTDNKIADKKSEISELQQREAAATAQAQQYAPFTNFASLQQARHSTVKSLADSRFDWERVMRELSRVIPSNVWLTHLTGSAGGADSSTAGAGTTDGSISGPSLQITGCATSQDAVAGFLSALRDIDGVTRVGLTSSERPEESAAGSEGDAAAATTDGAGAAGGSEDCSVRDFIPKFELVVAFDNAAVAQTAPTTPTTPTTPPATTPASTTSAPPTTTTTPTPPPTDSATTASSTTP